jgi:sarcosine oxidase subunit alpha
VRAKQVVLATGAMERPLVFANNDRPGVMLASAVSAYVNRYGVRPGTRSWSSPTKTVPTGPRFVLRRPASKWQPLSTRARRRAASCPERVRKAGIEVIDHAVVIDVRGTSRVAGVDVMSLDATGTAVTGPVTAFACDLLAISGGWSPIVHLHAQSGGKPRYDDAKAASSRDPRCSRNAPPEPPTAIFRLGDCLATVTRPAPRRPAAPALLRRSLRSRRPSPTSSRLRSSPCG